MVGTQQTFSTQIRVLICAHCAAPLPAPTAGGVATCEYCGIAQQVGPRPIGPEPLCAPPADLDEAQRIAWLRQQEQGYEQTDMPYGFSNTPQGLEWLLHEYLRRGTQDPTLRERVEPAFARLYAEARANPADAGAQRRLWWVANLLTEVTSAQDQFLRSRAVFEGTAEALSEPGYRYLLYAGLSKTARALGELDAAGQWLSLCHPRPVHLDLDSNFRVASGCLALVRGDFQGALAAVGRAFGEVPFAPASAHLSMMVRTAAYEALGQPALADQALADAVRRDSLLEAKDTLEVNDAVAWAKQTAARLEAGHPELAARPMSQGKQALLFYLVLLGVLLVVGGIAGAIFLLR